MERVGIRELKQNASAVIRRVTAGETLEVTEHGRPVARIVPLWPAGGVAQLIADGGADLPTEDGNIADLELMPPVPGRPLLSESLSELRAGER